MSIYYSRQSVLDEIDKWRKLFVKAARLAESLKRELDLRHIAIERDDDGTFIVSDDIVLAYGTGETAEEALRDYGESLVEYFEIVDASA